MELILLLLIAVVLVVAWRQRVKLLSKVLGQSEDRVARALERRKRK